MRERLLWIAVVKVVEEIDSVAIEPVSGSVVEVALGLMGEFFGEAPIASISLMGEFFGEAPIASVSLMGEVFEEAPIASVSLVGEVFGRAPIALVSPWYVFKSPKDFEEAGWMGVALGFRLLFLSVEGGEVSVVGLVVVEVGKEVEAEMIDMTESIRDEADRGLLVISVSVMKGVEGVAEKVVLVELPVEKGWRMSAVVPRKD
jgi:hypothetical protein